MRSLKLFYGYFFWQLGLIGLALVTLIDAGPVANEGEEMHDLETAEIILKIIEHKIQKLYKVHNKI